MRVLVLGCGPSGLIAANSAAMEGAEIAILSKPRKSFMKGAQYLHEQVRGIAGQKKFQIDYTLRGTAESYRLKVYGRDWDGTVSPEDMTARHDAYDIRDAYDKLWDVYGTSVIPWDATPGGLKVTLDKYKPDLTVSTVPAPLLCSQGHQFRAKKIWSTDKVLEPMDDNLVVCNGEENPAWYRASRIQGWENTEWPEHVKPPITPIWEVVKPTDNNCDCFPDVVRGGRYGRWEKGVLSHEIQDEVMELCRTAIRMGQ